MIINDYKLDCNLRRARGKIKEYALCNDWQFFVTLTLDKCKQDRYDIKAYIKRLGQYIQNENRKREIPITYLLIPEQHKDGAWHMHGFINGLTDSDICIDTSCKCRKRKRKVYHWIGYQERFGFTDLEYIEDKMKASNYITKYVTKDMSRSIKELNAKSYYCSRGLKRVEVIKRGDVTAYYITSYSVNIYDSSPEVVYSEMWSSDLI